MKISAQILEISGFTQVQVDRYFQIQDRVKYYGIDGLTISDRQFLRSAKVAATKVDAAHKAALVAGRSNRISGKNPVENKKHYRFESMLVSVIDSLMDLAADEVSCFSIVKNEKLRAFRLYQPVLDQVDTQQRGKFLRPEADLIQLGISFSGSRCVQIDADAAIKQMKSAFAEDWNTSWEAYFQNLVLVAIPASDELEFTSVVRPEIEKLTREAFRSVNVAD